MIAAQFAPMPADERADRDASLRADVVSGLRWVGASYYLNLGVRLGISVTLARLLSPSEFGVMALAMTVIGGLALVQESGFSSALVQYRGAPAQAAAVAWITSLASATVLGTVLLLAAPLVSEFFRHPELEPVLRALGAVLLVRAGGHAPRALLQRGMRFRESATIDVVATAVYGATGITLAIGGYGVWSLVYAQLASELATTTGALLRAPVRLRGVGFDAGVLRELSRFGRHIVFANGLGMLHMQLPALFVGKLFGAASLGLYEMALRWAWLPVQGVTHVAARVSYPAFARLRERPAELAEGYAGAFQGVVLLALPSAIGLALVADPLVRTLYGERWLGAIALLRILAFYGLFHSLAATTGETFKALGRPGFITGFAILYNGVLLGALLTLGTDLRGVAVATLAAPFVTATVAIVSLTRLIPLRLGRVLAIGARAAGAAAVMAAAVLAASAMTHDFAPPLRLASGALAGAATYVVALRLIEPGWLADAAAAMGLGWVRPGALFRRAPGVARVQS